MSGFTHTYLNFRQPFLGVGIAQWYSNGLMMGSLVLVKAGVVGEFSSIWSTFCADSYFGICSTPMSPQ